VKHVRTWRRGGGGGGGGGGGAPPPPAPPPRGHAGTPVVLGLLVLGATALPAQQAPRNCYVVIDSAGRAYQTSTATGALWFAGGGFLSHCRNQPTTMASDSVEWFSDRAELRLIGRVRFRDSVYTLDADRAVYWTRQERLVATGNVYTRNEATGSDLRGPSLEYLRAVPPIRDTLELYAVGRPLIHLTTADSAGADSTEPFVVRADRVWMRGTETTWGSGRVTIDRSDLSARADSAIIDLRDSVGVLVGAPVVHALDSAATGPDSVTYRLTGQRIRFELTAGRQIRRVVSMGDADATGPGWHLVSDTLDLALDSSRIQRAQAWGANIRPRAVSDQSTITADSLDIRMPGQVMDLVLAYGNAQATSRSDTTRPEDDWLSGDSLRAHFARTDAGGAGRSEIRRVLAFGGAESPARSYYHVENDRDRAGPRGISYSRGRRIQIAMQARKVRTVDIVGQVDGVYLEPLPPGADSLAADSVPTDTTVIRAPTRTTRPAPRPAPQPTP
jgi:lipopolysaccharide export system protein LptA